MKILITGGLGYIGSMLNLDHDIDIYDINLYNSRIQNNVIQEINFKEVYDLLINLKIEKTVSGGSVANSIVGLSQLGNKVGFIER